MRPSLSDLLTSLIAPYGKAYMSTDLVHASSTNLHFGLFSSISLIAEIHGSGLEVPHSTILMRLPSLASLGFSWLFRDGG